MAEQRWTGYDAKQAYLTTELTGVADGANKLGAAITFSTAGSDRKLYLDVGFVLASTDLSGETNPAMKLWMIGCLDDTNFEDGSDTVNPARAPDMIIPLRAFNGVQRVLTRFLRTTPNKGKILVENGTGATILAGAELNYRMYSEQSV